MIRAMVLCRSKFPSRERCYRLYSNATQDELNKKNIFEATWESMVEKEMRGKGGGTPKDLVWHTPEVNLYSSTVIYFEKITRSFQGIDVKPIYSRSDVPHIDEKEVEQEIPGKFPFTRGPYASMYTVRPWTIRQVNSSNL